MSTENGKSKAKGSFSSKKEAKIHWKPEYSSEGGRNKRGFMFRRRGMSRLVLVLMMGLKSNDEEQMVEDAIGTPKELQRVLHTESWGQLQA